MISAYQQQFRGRLLAAPVIAPTAPWRPVLDRRTPVGGLLGVGFARASDTGHDLAMVISYDGHGFFDATTGEKIARDRDPETAIPTPPRAPRRGSRPLMPRTAAHHRNPSAHRRTLRRRVAQHHC